MLKLLPAALIAGVVLVGRPTWAQPIKTPEVSLAEVQEQVSTQERSLTELATSIAIQTKAVNQLSLELTRLTEEGRRLKMEFDGLEDERNSLEDSLQLLDQGHKHLNTSSKGRIRALFMTRGSIPPLLLLAGGVERIAQLEKSAVYLRRVRAHDVSTLSSLAAAMRERRDKILRLSRIITEQREVRSKLEQKRDEVTKKRVIQENALIKVRDGKKQRERLLIELRAQAARLEAIVVSLVEEDESVQEESAGAAADEGNAEDTGNKSRSFFDLFSREKAVAHSAGLGVGKYPLPIEAAEVLSENAGEGESLRSFAQKKGTRYQASDGQVVRVIEGGSVAFAGNMPGYGNVVIVDHGQRYHTLYAGVGDISVKKGHVVERADELALAKKPELYFEIRYQGKAVDAERVFSGKVTSPKKAPARPLPVPAKGKGKKKGR